MDSAVEAFIIQIGPWAQKGKCRGATPGRFFPGSLAEAQTVIDSFCKVCPVRKDCLEYALRRHETDGVWGGVYFANKKRRARAAAAASRRAS